MLMQASPILAEIGLWAPLVQYMHFVIYMPKVTLIRPHSCAPITLEGQKVRTNENSI